ncbi:MAG: FAD-linked oxidase C-terminal domain-containing protein, partial [Acidimicrobiales bacterium]
RSFVVRGSGTGLAGGAVPVEDSLLIVTTRMNQILEIDPVERVAWVEPGVLNLDLSRATAEQGLYFAPDPSSQQTCSIGGNVANNSGGPHCLAYGVTSAHVLALEVVMPDGELATFGDAVSEQRGYDLRGVVVGSEGTMGVVTKAAVRLTQTPPDVITMLFGFASVADGAATVSAIIAAGIIPAALEMMDHNAIRVVEDFVAAGLPREAEAVLLVEIDGLGVGIAHEAERISELARANNATSERTAADDLERDLLWKGRKNAFGAVARLEPDYYLHDTVVPRKSLVEVLEKVNAVAENYGLTIVNVFHAGDGNLHPILAFDGSDGEVRERVHKAAVEIVQISLDAGGSLSGEHGIGLEKRDYMTLVFSQADLAAQELVRATFDPEMRSNPAKVLPGGSRCGELSAVGSIAVDEDVALRGDEMWV